MEKMRERKQSDLIYKFFIYSAVLTAPSVFDCENKYEMGSLPLAPPLGSPEASDITLQMKAPSMAQGRFAVNLSH